MNKFQHKTHGIDGNVGTGGFTEQEAEQLKKALIDLSNRIRRAAENIQAGLNPWPFQTQKPQVGLRTQPFLVLRVSVIS